MLVECTIRNFAVIEYVQVRFHRGFHVITGETGAGKSMIIDALGLAAGGRVSADFVRHGADRAEIECVFDLPADHPVYDFLRQSEIAADPDEYLIIRREVSASGKSAARINGQAVTLSLLREIGDWLIHIHGQHEHQALFYPEHQLRLLDLYGGAELAEALEAFRKSYRGYMETVRLCEEWENNQKQNIQMLDLYRFQIEEIASAALRPGEEAELEDERRKLAHAEKLMLQAGEAYECLNGQRGALGAIGTAMQRLEEAARHDPSLSPLAEQIAGAYYTLEDAAFQLRDYREDIEINPERLDAVEKRLDLIANLRRKYGETVTDILDYLERIRRQVEQTENYEETVEKLRRQAEEQREETAKRAERLTLLRKRAAERLAGKVTEELKELHMEKTEFEIAVRPRGAWSDIGADEVEFLISPNPGEPLRPLHKIASGGEISRMMLALKTVLAEAESIPVLVFDEVDTGVSGRAAQAIAEKMARLAAGCQVFSITHLPQVACMADHHYLIEKHVAEGRTATVVTPLEGGGRIRELARMLGGVEVTETTERHAAEMLDMAALKKSGWHHLQS